MGLSSITKIPAIMRANSWVNGATLMDKWFAGPPSAKPTYTTPDLSTIKMDAFVLKFKRAKEVYDAMVSGKIWSNASAKPLFATRLRSLGMLGGAPATFDFSSKSLPDLHALHVNFRAVDGGIFQSLDDMVAALGNFSIYVSPLTGDVRPEGTLYRVTLRQVGFHIMDSFDFEGDQDLGYWDEPTNQVSAHFTWSGTKVTNEMFRNWRTANGKGGDFLVYSDVKPLTIDPPDSFLI